MRFRQIKDRLRINVIFPQKYTLYSPNFNNKRGFHLYIQLNRGTTH